MRTVIPTSMVDDYNAHKITVYDISERIGRSPSTVYHALKVQDVDTGSYRKRLEGRNRRVVEAYRKIGNQEEVSKLFGISKQRVHQIIERNSPEILPRKKS